MARHAMTPLFWPEGLSNIRIAEEGLPAFFKIKISRARFKNGSEGKIMTQSRKGSSKKIEGKSDKGKEVTEKGGVETPSDGKSRINLVLRPEDLSLIQNSRGLWKRRDVSRQFNSY